MSEYDQKQCRNNARKVLKYCRKLSRISECDVETLKSHVVNATSKTIGGEYDKQMVSAVDRLDRKRAAEIELNQITDAILKLDDEERLIIYLTYMTPNKSNDLVISEQIYKNLISVRTMQNRRDKALIHFCEAYKKGKLLAFK